MKTNPNHPHTTIFTRPYFVVRCFPAAFLFFFLISLLFSSSSLGQTQEDMPSGRIVYLPFTVMTNTPGKYLQDGLTGILATRLTRRTGLTAIHKTKQTMQLTTFMEQGNRQAFRKMMQDLQADYLVIASLEQQTDNFEIFVYVFDKQKDIPFSFSRKIPDLVKAIPALDAITEEITAVVFHKSRPQSLSEKNVQTTTEQGINGFQTTHPDRAYREGLYQKAAPVKQDNSTSTSTLPSWHSEPLEPAVQSMEIGDLDGDGLHEIVLVQHGNLSIYRFNADQLQHIADYAIPSYLTPRAIRLGDLDGNGLQEIYLTTTNGNRPSSQVLEWDGTTFFSRVSNAPYYIRPGVDAEGKSILLGQKSNTKGPINHIFYELTRTADGTLEQARELTIPAPCNLFDFIRADLDNDDSLEFIGFTEADRLVIISSSGEELWKSKEILGASRDFFGNVSMGKEDTDSPVYLHSRIIVRDLNGDDRPEIVISNNRLASSRYFLRLRYFNGSSIRFFNWNGEDMGILKKSQILAGYIPDFQVVTDKDGAVQVFAVENINGSSLFFWRTEKSILHRLDMGQL